MWLLVKNNSSKFRPIWENNGLSLLPPLFNKTMQLALANSKKVSTRNFGSTTTSQNKSLKAIHGKYVKICICKNQLLEEINLPKINLVKVNNKPTETLPVFLIDELCLQ